MADVEVPRGASAKLERVEGGLKVGDNAKIQASNGKLIVVTGGARFDGNALVDCDLECTTLRVERSGRLRVNGDLTVHGTLDVLNSIEVAGTMKAETVDVGGHVKARSASCMRMRVGGTAEISELLQAESVEVGGKIEARGTLDIKDLQVGGKAEIGGGTITGAINVGGKFESLSKLDFGDLQIYGAGSIAAGSSGKRIAVSGKLKVRGDLWCDQIEIAGAASILGDCKATQVEVKGKLEVSGSLSVSGGLDIHGTSEVNNALTGDFLKLSGKLSAEKAILARDAEISGAVETRKGLKAKCILVMSGTRCAGPIIGEMVNVGESGPGLSAFVWGQRLRVQVGTSQVEDIYASRLIVGPGSRAKRIFAETVELGSGCDVDQVTYVKELKVDEHAKILHPVSKVDKLKEPPLWE